MNNLFQNTENLKYIRIAKNERRAKKELNKTKKQSSFTTPK